MGTRSVHPAPQGQKLGANPGKKGETYYAFEGQATRVTTRYADATVVSERSFDGDLHTTLTDLSGVELGRFKVDRIDGEHDVLQYAPQSGKSIQVFKDPAVRPSLDWSGHQAYSLWKDAADGDVSLEWQGDMMRRRGGGARNPAHLALEMQTEWPDDIAAKTVRRTVHQVKFIPGRVFTGDVYVTRLMRHGTEVGLLNWFARDQVLVWNLPGLTKGYIGPEHLKDYGGWPFAPDMAWMNLQTVAFQHFKTLIQKDGFVARRAPAWPDRIRQFFTPTLSANDEGCDGLHWLDGTVFRFCCDVHDLCYSANGCTAKSWWMIWTSWRCDYCNVWVVDCFLNGGEEWNLRGMAK